MKPVFRWKLFLAKLARSFQPRPQQHHHQQQQQQPTEWAIGGVPVINVLIVSHGALMKRAYKWMHSELSCGFHNENSPTSATSKFAHEMERMVSNTSISSFSMRLVLERIERSAAAHLAAEVASSTPTSSHIKNDELVAFLNEVYQGVTCNYLNNHDHLPL